MLVISPTVIDFSAETQSLHQVQQTFSYRAGLASWRKFSVLRQKLVVIGEESKTIKKNTFIKQ